MATNTGDPSEGISRGQARALMEAWTQPGYLRSEWHETLLLRARGALAGEGNIVIYGDSGTGKTSAIRWMSRVLNEEIQQKGQGQSVLEIPRNPILSYSGSQMQNSKSALRTLFEKARGGFAMSPSEIRRYDPSSLLDQVVGELRERRLRLVIIDEAQFIDSENLKLLRQVADRGDEVGHPVRLCLVGTMTLLDALTESGQRGQRFAWETHIAPLTLGEFRKHFSGFHPILPHVEASMTSREWRKLLNELHDRTRGKMRRIKDLLQGAQRLALRLDEVLTAEHLRRTADELAPE